MNGKYIWVVLLLAIALGVLVFIFGKSTAEAPTDEGQGEIESIEEVGVSFFNDFFAIAPPAEDDDASERLMGILSESASEGIDIETLSRDLALFVGVQDIPDEGFEVVDIALGEDGTANMVVQLNYSGGPAIRKVEMIKENDEWKVDSVSEVEMESQTGEVFEETGNLIINNPGLPEGVWYLVYEGPGEPALNEALVFTEDSVCISDEGEEVCDLDVLEEGSRVEVKGLATEDGVEVETLRHI